MQFAAAPHADQFNALALAVKIGPRGGIVGSGSCVSRS